MENANFERFNYISIDAVNEILFGILNRNKDILSPNELK